MAIYRMVGEKESLTRIADTSFEKEGVLEREDLQRILRDQPDILEPGLFVIAEEFGDWDDSNRRIDLLCLDAGGRLVVVELKRGESGDLMDLQSIRYAAMVSAITLQQAIDAHQAYLNKQIIDEDAAERVNGYLENLDDPQGFSTKQPRIVLVSEGFSSELTTSVLWLNSNGLDITCIRMQPYRNGAELLVETSQVIPLPEAADYLVRIRDRESEVQKQGASQPWYTKGGDAFKKSIENAPVSFQPELNLLYNWAVSMEQQGLVALDTHSGKSNSLRLLVPGGSGLITVISSPTGAPYIQLWRSVFEKNAPNSIESVEEKTGPLKQGNSVRKISDDLLAALTAAYREANGLPGDGEDGGDGE